MHSPLDAFPSERSGQASTRGSKVPSAPVRGGGQSPAPVPPPGPVVRAARRAMAMSRTIASSLHAISAHAIGAEREARWSRRAIGAGRAIAAKGRPATVAGVSAAGTALAAGRRSATRLSAEVRQRWNAAPAWVHDDRVSVVATAAVTSVCVSLLTIWMWGAGGSSAVASIPTPSAAAMERDAGASSPDPAPRVSEPMTPQARQVEAPPRQVETPARQVGPPAQPAATPPKISRITEAASAPAPSRRSDTTPAPPSPAANSSTSSRLVITTEPDGASVTINGVGWGTTPLTIRYLPPGTKRIRVTRPGYHTEERVVSVDAGRGPAPLRITLREASETREVR